MASRAKTSTFVSGSLGQRFESRRRAKGSEQEAAEPSIRRLASAQISAGRIEFFALAAGSCLATRGVMFEKSRRRLSRTARRQVKSHWALASSPPEQSAGVGAKFVKIIIIITIMIIVIIAPFQWAARRSRAASRRRRHNAAAAVPSRTGRRRGQCTGSRGVLWRPLITRAGETRRKAPALAAVSSGRTRPKTCPGRRLLPVAHIKQVALVGADPNTCPMQPRTISRPPLNSAATAAWLQLELSLARPRDSGILSRSRRKFGRVLTVIIKSDRPDKLDELRREVDEVLGRVDKGKGLRARLLNSICG